MTGLLIFAGVYAVGVVLFAVAWRHWRRQARRRMVVRIAVDRLARQSEIDDALRVYEALPKVRRMAVKANGSVDSQ